jgi:signal peptidase II
MADLPPGRAVRSAGRDRKEADMPTWAWIVIAVVVIAVVALGALLAFFLTHLRRRLVWLPTGLLLGGAAGNLIDRLREGAVTDFIKLPHWPAFNLADTCITIGVLVLVYVLERVR